jgi:hypothetical protein
MEYRKIKKQESNSRTYKIAKDDLTYVYNKCYIVTCMVVRVTRMTNYSSDDWIY